MSSVALDSRAEICLFQCPFGYLTFIFTESKFLELLSHLTTFMTSFVSRSCNIPDLFAATVEVMYEQKFEKCLGKFHSIYEKCWFFNSYPIL